MKAFHILEIEYKREYGDWEWSVNSFFYDSSSVGKGRYIFYSGTMRVFFFRDRDTFHGIITKNVKGENWRIYLSTLIEYDKSYCYILRINILYTPAMPYYIYAKIR